MNQKIKYLLKNLPLMQLILKHLLISGEHILFLKITFNSSFSRRNIRESCLFPVMWYI